MPDRPESRSSDGPDERISTAAARQAVTGTGAKYVLRISLALVVVTFAIIYFVMLR